VTKVAWQQHLANTFLTNFWWRCFVFMFFFPTLSFLFFGDGLRLPGHAQGFRLANRIASSLDAWPAKSVCRLLTAGQGFRILQPTRPSIQTMGQHPALLSTMQAYNEE